MSSANLYALNLDKSIILSFGKALTLYRTTNFLDWSKLKAFADDKLNLAEKLKFVWGGVENIGYQHFLLFPQCFQKVSILGSLKVGIVW